MSKSRRPPKSKTDKSDTPPETESTQTNSVDRSTAITPTIPPRDVKDAKARWKQWQKEIAFWAEVIKIILQMVIGFLIIILVLIKVTVVFLNQSSILQTDVLQIVGVGLLLSSAVELAYTLFTPGPDEAVDPLIMGLAAMILLGLAQLDYQDILKADEITRNVSLFVAILAILFVIRKWLLRDKND